MKRFLIIFFAIIFASSGIASAFIFNPNNSANANENADTTIYAESLIAPEEITLSNNGESYQINPVILPSNCEVSPVFISNNPNLLSIDSFGNITPIQKGTASIQISIFSSATTYLLKQINVIIENPLEISSSGILNSDDITPSALNCGAKMDETYETYTLFAATNKDISTYGVSWLIDYAETSVDGLFETVGFPYYSIDGKTYYQDINFLQPFNFSLAVKFSKPEILSTTALNEKDTSSEFLLVETNEYETTFDFSFDKTLEIENDSYVLYFNSEVAEYPETTNNSCELLMNSIFIAITSDSNIISIAENKITAIGLGECIITLTSNDGGQFSKDISFIVKSYEPPAQEEEEEPDEDDPPVEDPDDTPAPYFALTPSPTSSPNISFDFNNNVIYFNNFPSNADNGISFIFQLCDLEENACIATILSGSEYIEDSLIISTSVFIIPKAIGTIVIRIASVTYPNDYYYDLQIIIS